MTAPLDESGLKAAIRAIKSPRCTCAYEDLASTAIRAYLAATALPDGMEVVDVVGWAYRGPKGGLIVTEEKPSHAPEANALVDAADLVQAQSALAAMRAERDEWRDHVQKQNANVAYNLQRAEVAEAQVLRLTEENEALRKALKRIADMTGTAGMEAGPLCEWTENGVTTMRPSGVGSFANAIARATLNSRENKE
jgi:hypothetical protein